MTDDNARNWHGYIVHSALDVCYLLNRIAALSEEDARDRYGNTLVDDASDAPVWGGKLRLIASCHTVWSWDADGVVVGGDGSFTDGTPYRYLSWDEVFP
jgi:hypothetical protein